MELVCDGCGARVEPGPHLPHPFTCPHAGDGAEHVLAAVLDDDAIVAPAEDPDTFRAHRRALYSWALAREHGLADSDWLHALDRLQDAIQQVAGAPVHATPTLARPAVASALGLGARLWAKDETGQVAGSHKVRHLLGLALNLEVVQALGWDDGTRPLAIASCGNAALAAAVVARAAGRTLLVYIPTDADPAVVDELRAHGAQIDVCAREPGRPGDPCVHAFLDALAAGALPFCCQGPYNGLCIEGGHTLAWELFAATRHVALDHVVVQVGGGALASSVVRVLLDLHRRGSLATPPRIHTVQTTGAAPLARATERVRARAGEEGLVSALEHAATHRSAYMWPWEEPPHSVAHGILDDETYDWHRVVAGTLSTGGTALVVDEPTLLRARAVAQEAGGVPVSATGAAGLAGVIELNRRGLIEPGSEVAVLWTGVERS